MLQELFALLVFLIILGTLSVVVMLSLMKAHKEKLRFEERMTQAIDPITRPIQVEEVSLTKTESQSTVYKEKLLALIGADLAQVEAYPIPWWLIPPVGVILSFMLVWLAIHPIGYAFIMYSAGWPAASFFVTKSIFGWFNNKRNSKLIEQFPDALNTIVRCIRVGIPMAEALRTVARDAQEPTKAEFIILADKVAIGIPLDIALRELSLRIRLTEYQFFATAITLQSRSGGGITQTLETLSEVIRRRVGLKARGYALTAEARTSAMLLAVLPFVAGVAIFFMQRPYIILLFNTKSGQSCLAAAIMMLMVGMGIIQTMINNVLK
jgi:tight adherence protein B